MLSIHSRLGIWLMMVMAVGCLVVSASAATIHVASDGKPTGDGSKEKPLDLATAISAQSPAKPGDTLLLKGGQYDGPMKSEKERAPFEPKISGTSEKTPIIITSAPGEWAHINGAINVNGAHYLHFVRLEIGDLKWDQLQEKHVCPTAFNVIDGKGVKLINCNVFGGAMGTGLWTPAIDLEAYGNLVHDFGYHREGLRGSGHAFYMQNNVGTKTIQRNIAYRSAGWLYDIYTQAGTVNGFDILENIGFLGGYYKKGQVSFSYGLTGWKPAERIRFIGNVAYQPRDTEQYRSNMRLMTHYKTDVIHHDAVVKDNYIMGAYRAMSIGMWQDITVTGNTFWATGYLTEVSSGPSGSGIEKHPQLPDRKNYKIDNNTYYATPLEKPFIYGQHEKALPEEQYTFAQWQTLGFDKNSQVLPTRDRRPTGTKVFVFDNKYEPGRGNVAIFNWDSKGQIEVDLSKVLKAGQKYAIYNCLDIPQTIAKAKPVLTGTFDGKPVAFPMKKDTASPYFDAFLILPQ